MHNEIDTDTRTKIEAAAFQSLLGYLRSRTDVQNIDLMILAGFCRNCLAKWYKKAAEDHKIDMDYETARTIIYGMPFADYRDTYQTEATEAQLQAYASAPKAKI